MGAGLSPACYAGTRGQVGSPVAPGAFPVPSFHQRQWEGHPTAESGGAPGGDCGPASSQLCPPQQAEPLCPHLDNGCVPRSVSVGCHTHHHAPTVCLHGRNSSPPGPAGWKPRGEAWAGWVPPRAQREKFPSSVPASRGFRHSLAVDGRLLPPSSLCVSVSKWPFFL